MGLSPFLYGQHAPHQDVGPSKTANNYYFQVIKEKAKRGRRIKTLIIGGRMKEVSVCYKHVPFDSPDDESDRWAISFGGGLPFVSRPIVIKARSVKT